MLQRLRGLANHFLVKVLMGIMMLSFALFFGLSDFGGGGGRGVVAEIGGTAIATETVRRAVNQRLRQIETGMGGRLTPVQARRLGVVEQQLEALIAQTLILEETNRLLLTIGDDRVSEAIRKDPAFQGNDGQLAKRRFADAAAGLGMTEVEFVDDTRRRLAAGMLISSINDSVLAPKFLVRRIALHDEESRAGQAILVTGASIPAETIKDSALRKEYDDHPDRYRTQEYRNATVLRLDPAEIADTLAPAEEVLRKAFEERKEEFFVPEKRAALQYVGERAIAERITADIRSGKSFIAAVKAQAKIEPVPISLSQRAHFFPELAEHIFALDKNKTSEAFQSKLGWHVVQITAITPAVSPDYAASRELLRKEFAENEALAAISDLSDRLIDDLASGETVEEAGKKIGALVVRTGSITRSGALAPGQKGKPVKLSQEMRSEIFSLEPGAESDLLSDPSGAILLVRLDKILPVRRQSFDEARARILAEQTAALRTEKANKKAKAIVKRINEGTKPAAIARKDKLELIPIEEVKRADLFDSSLRARDPVGATLRQALFDDDEATGVAAAKDRAKLARIVPIPNGFAIVQASVVKQAVKVGPDRETEKQTTLGQEIAADLLRAYTDRLRILLPPTIHGDVLDREYPRTIEQGG